MKTPSKEELIQSFVVGKLAKNNEHMGVGYDDNLITGGIVDSLGILQLIIFLEDEFSVKIKDDDIVPENFETIGVIAKYIDTTR